MSSLRDHLDRHRINRRDPTANTLNALLRLALEDVELEELLRRSLALVLNEPWPTTLGVGAVFLVDENTKELVLKAHNGIGPAIAERCLRIPFGRCVCGRVASSGKTLFCNSIDREHEIMCAGVAPHGHYCVPITAGGTVLGVLNVYLRAGHVRNAREEEFFVTFASTLAGIVVRKKIEDENRKVREKLLLKEIEAAEARAQREVAETRSALLSRLNESEERARIAIEAADLGVWSWDLTTNQNVWSDRCKQLFGLPLEIDPSYESFLQVLHPEDRDRVQRTHLDALSNHTDYNIEYRVIWPDSSIHWVIAKGHGIYDNSGKPLRMTGVAMDITDRKLAEQALVRSEKLASVGRLAASIAHEINNPLEAVVNALFLISCDRSLSPETRANVDLADQELRRVTHMTRQALGFYREDTRPAVVHLPELIDELLTLYQRKADYKHITIHREYSENCQVWGIVGELRQVVSNLISNSIDAIESDGAIHIRICKTSIKHHAVRLTIADNGSGISRDQLPVVFEPFFTTKKDVGTGLGLWVTKQLVEKHHGCIRFRSRLGKGTVFCVFLPYAEEDLTGLDKEEQAATS